MPIGQGARGPDRHRDNARRTVIDQPQNSLIWAIALLTFSW
jgi:hypothetical protein